MSPLKPTSRTGRRGPFAACQHGKVTQISSGRLRTANAADSARLLRLWDLLFDENGTTSEEPWKGYAREWFTRYVDDTRNARFPVIEVAGELVATAIGTLEIGVPNPQCVRGRTVRLTNVITLPEHRGQGHGTTLVLDVVAWARSIAADRVDLSATPAGQRIYQKLGFTVTSAPRMKLVL
jgi:ribosomal protein S18 acetylase RimI-like enzyme